jgi:hypothetical protein
MSMFGSAVCGGGNLNPFSKSPFPPEVVSNAAYGAGVLAIHAPAAVFSPPFSLHNVFVLFNEFVGPASRPGARAQISGVSTQQQARANLNPDDAAFYRSVLITFTTYTHQLVLFSSCLTFHAAPTIATTLSLHLVAS